MPELLCRALNTYLGVDRLLRSSVPSALTLAFVKCYAELEESAKRSGDARQDIDKLLEGYMSLFSREASEKIYNAFKCNNIKDLLTAARNHIAEIIDGYKGASLGVIFRAKLVSRLLIHMRSPYIPFYVGIAWDPYMNLPYIPSTSIKGVVRSYFKRYNVKVGEYSYEDLFGTTDSEGLLIFHDAYPVQCGNKRGDLLELDVVTPHYREAENRISEVDVSPTPIVFLTVAPGTVFHVPVIITEIDSKLVGDLLDNIGKALEEGIGAKTALGYGSIKVVGKQVS